MNPDEIKAKANELLHETYWQMNTFNRDDERDERLFRLFEKALTEAQEAGRTMQALKGKP